MKTCIKCGSHAFNLYAEGIDQGGFCDVHYWQGRAHRAEALAQPEKGLFIDLIAQHEGLAEEMAQPEQEPVAWIEHDDETAEPCPSCGKPQLRQEPSITKEARGTLILHSGWDDLPNGTKFYTTPPKPEPHNFCPRCGKRLVGMAFAAGGVHTCTPPEGGYQ